LKGHDNIALSPKRKGRKQEKEEEKDKKKENKNQMVFDIVLMGRNDTRITQV